MAKPPGDEQLEALEAIFGALDHPARRQILLALRFRSGRMSAGDIAGRFRHAWPTTTRHLKVLEAAGLVSSHSEGRMQIYLLNRERLRVVADWLSWFDEALRQD